MYIWIQHFLYIEHTNYVQTAQNTEERSNSSTKSPIARRPYLQSPHHSEPRDGVFQKPEEPPKVVALQLSWLAFLANRPYLPFLQLLPDHWVKDVNESNKESWMLLKLNAPEIGKNW